MYRSFLMGLGAALAVMVVLGIAQRFWRGSQIEEAGAAGLGIRFARATRRPIRVLEERVDTQMRLLNDRLFEVERELAELRRALPPTEEDE